jgi:hypothetical protein
MRFYILAHEFSQHLGGGSVVGTTEREKPLAEVTFNSDTKSRVLSHAASVAIGYTLG